MACKVTDPGYILVLLPWAYKPLENLLENKWLWSTSIDEDAEKLEFLYTADGIVKWKRHYENQSGSFPKW